MQLDDKGRKNAASADNKLLLVLPSDGRDNLGGNIFDASAKILMMFFRFLTSFKMALRALGLIALNTRPVWAMRGSRTPLARSVLTMFRLTSIISTDMVKSSSACPPLAKAARAAEPVNSNPSNAMPGVPGSPAAETAKESPIIVPAILLMPSTALSAAADTLLMAVLKKLKRS